MVVPSSKNSQILLIEDTPSFQDLMLFAFEENDFPYKLHIVSEGEAALKFLHQQEPYIDVPRPDLIILDLNLPKMSGYDLLKIVKQKRNFKAIPIIVLTSSTEQTDILKSYNLKANCYITKPYNLKEFINIVKISIDFWLNSCQLSKT